MKFSPQFAILALLTTFLLFSTSSAIPAIFRQSNNENGDESPEVGDPSPELTDDGENGIGGPGRPTPPSSPDPDDEGSPSPTEDDPICFPEDATVELENGHIIRMEELDIGDRVKVAEGVYSDVFMFTHRLSDETAEFVKISVAGGKSIRATPGHYLYVNGHLAAAKAVKIGDTLEVDGTCAPVNSVERINGKGLYNPQTLHGDVIVDGFKASTYTTTVEPRAAHWLLAPMRGIYKITGFSTAAFDAGNFGLAKFAPKGQDVY